MLVKQCWRLIKWPNSLMARVIRVSRWRIGARSSLLIYGDRWIPRLHSFMIQSPLILGQDTTAEAILSLPLSAQADDVLIWHFGKYGNYLVRSDYKPSKSLLSIEVPSDSAGLGCWKSIWIMNVPPKVKSFIWKVCRNWIPLLFNITSRGISYNGICPVCFKVPETTTHAL
ncbi:hypothetical protein LWI28_016177 [Acer negundo]|uniref:Reverse transcriptase zinc-binding domain-containing protein n=1 Tax=Acer negundo TaxID=4023 RepID=A0AAD5NIZ7_ACENE|nr:hypothetical protein LWI28_016177 [Acer negundo]